ncbi:MAG: glycoside hydrolase family 127 protein [Gorillibacterium sp.]|nr:glycoside hydrolase family 127 protein [Gorillibacterium sp.]
MNKISEHYRKSWEPLALNQVTIDDAFWSPRQLNIASVVVPYQWAALNDAIPGAEPSHTIDNFRLAAGEAEGTFYGMVFQDSDLGKWLETVGFLLAQKRDPALEQIADDVIDLLGRAQQPDGYLNTYYTVKEPNARWSNLRDHHELYCAGHLMEAASAYYEATGKQKILDIMSRYADYIATVFGKGPAQKQGYDGHPEIELALVKLYQSTGNDKYLALSKFFVDERGQVPHFFDLEAPERKESGEHHHWSEYDYYQAHLPVREQSTAEGHSVRAVYLYSAMADLAAAYKDTALLQACQALWKDVVSKKMYVTGGIGSSSHGERFTVAYDLPNDRAYTETCAAIGLMFWANRMLQVERKREYADVMELALYNGVLSGISLDGKSYFYVNPLEVWPETANYRQDMESVKVTRQPWFGCACCPPNIARLIASLGHYVYAQNIDKREISVHLYVGSKVALEFAGESVQLTQHTQYPWDGQVDFDLSLEHPTVFTLSLRIPAWCDKAVLSVNGQELDVTIAEDGYVSLEQVWNPGDHISLQLDMAVTILHSHPNLRENAGKVALQRGPVVYCLEEADNGVNLHDIVLSTDAELKVHFDEGLLGGVAVITTSGSRSDVDLNAEAPLYSTKAYDRTPTVITAIPYFAWSNRGAGEMTVWIRQG